MSVADFLKSKVFFKQFFYSVLIFFSLLVIALIYLSIYTHHGETIPVPDFRGLKISEVRDIAAKNSLNYQIIDSAFLSKHKKGTVIDQNPPPDFKVKKNRTIFLTINAFQTEKVKMPNLVGLSQRQAEATIENLGLRVGKIDYIPDLAINNVLKQRFRDNDIPEGRSIEKGSVIDLMLGKGISEEETFVPHLTGLTKNEARILTENEMLHIGAIIADGNIKSSKDSANAKIYKQSPAWNRNHVVRLGTAIDVWITLDEAKIPSDSIKDIEK
ncbi:MAG: PASTA domain-containing protein [Bacteroidia bacterium]|nr:PASTA domain-containing protein [Bacteroidia bacterium]